MAAPVVSGAAALLLEKYPDLTNVEVKIRMKESAEDLGLPKNWQGWGRIHIGRLTRYTKRKGLTSILELDKMTPMQGLQESMYEEDTEDGKNKNDHSLSGDGWR